MAEILILNRLGIARSGEIVTVRPDGWAWGGAEKDPAKFRIVHIPDDELKAMGHTFEGPIDQRRMKSLMVRSNPLGEDRPKLVTRVEEADKFSTDQIQRITIDKLVPSTRTVEVAR